MNVQAASSTPSEERAFGPTVLDSLREAIRRVPDRTAIIYPEMSLTYRELGRAISGIKRHIAAARVGSGPIVIMMPNCPEMSAAVHAAWLAGGQASFVNPKYSMRELAALLDDASPSLIIAKTGHDAVSEEYASQFDLPLLVLGDGDLAVDAWIQDPGNDLDEDEIDVEPGMLATMMFTGGTTGVPKPLTHTHHSLMTTVRGMEACWPTTIDREVWLNVAPMFHIWGLLMGLLNPIYGGATLVMAPRFNPAEVIADLEKYQVSVFSGGPAEIYKGLVNNPAIETSDLSHLRLCPGGGSRFSIALLERWHAKTGTHIYEAFGMTEIAPITCNPWGKTPRYGSVGTPAPHVEVQVVDILDATPLANGQVGEVAVRAPHLAQSLLGTSDDQRIGDGWFLSGDLGRLDDDGYLWIQDRKKDMIIVGGFNVYPREIEEVLLEHSAVVEAVTIGVDDERKGQRPVSFVVLAPGADADTSTLANHCNERLIDYKRPLDVLIVEEVPRTPANKIDRRQLQSDWALRP